MDSVIKILGLVFVKAITHCLHVLFKTFLVLMAALEMVSVPQLPEFVNANILINQMIVQLQFAILLIVLDTELVTLLSEYAIVPFHILELLAQFQTPPAQMIAVV